MIYFDNSSTTRQYDEVSKLIYDISTGEFGNPSSLHEVGFRANKLLEEARGRVAKCLPMAGSVIFTSGGTESDNAAIMSAVRKNKRAGKRIITTAIEHPAVSEMCMRLSEDGYDIEYITCDGFGTIDPCDLKDALTTDTVLVSIMTVNNEVGTIEPVIESYDIVNAYNRDNDASVIFHTDAVQAFGKLDMTNVPFDMISISAHKFHGPKGIGALYVKNPGDYRPMIMGGGQESGYRSGTENLPAIAGMGLATEMACKSLDDKVESMAKVNDHLYRGLVAEIPDVKLNGPYELGISITDAGKRCPSVLNVSFAGTRGEVLLHTLEQDGIYVSTGSACSSNHPGESHVLQAMGMDKKEIEGAIRFSLSEFSTIDEADIVIDRVKQAVARFRSLGSYQ